MNSYFVFLNERRTSSCKFVVVESLKVCTHYNVKSFPKPKKKAKSKKAAGGIDVKKMLWPRKSSSGISKMENES